MNCELQRLKAKFAELIRRPLKRFPAERGRLSETDKRGVYIIYSPPGGCSTSAGRPEAKEASPLSKIIQWLKRVVAVWSRALANQQQVSPRERPCLCSIKRTNMA
jgi:hypothetical protein